MHVSTAWTAGAALAGFLLAAVAAVAAESRGDIVIAQARTSSTSIESAYRTGKLAKRTYPATLIDQARRSEDELEECMENPDNAHIEYIELLGACFCLATDAQTEGCQSSD